METSVKKTIGKTINIFLMDGSSTGRIKATLSNRTVVAYKIPRSKLEECKLDSRDIKKHLQQAGIYFLLGEENLQAYIYIGQADKRNKKQTGLMDRISEHYGEDYEWNEVLILTRTDGSIEDLNYLESRFFQLANAAKTYELKNKNCPTQGDPREEKKEELEEFISDSKLIIETLGINAFEKIDPPNDVTSILHFEGKEFSAKGYQSDQGFILQKGSHIRPNLTKSAPEITSKLRKKYADMIDEQWITKEDLRFGSSSAAAAFVAGYSVNGREKWTDNSGKTLKELSETPKESS